MDKVGGNVFLVPLGDLLDDDFGLVYSARREQPSWGLRYYPPAGTNPHSQGLPDDNLT